ncbi:glycosyltransferase family 2 protein [Streptomyces sp. NPDC002088]|uniref:glycosyltransferase family 2 protein n=1 Tax=Streptomyces sp. NPDC002088 TaxID=3154665 RepID=UPI003333C749
MAGPTVSVIIAAYNAMPYLTRCIESVADQTIGREQLEVIAVNDGSTDTTPAELERLAAVYPKLLRVVHQENSGGPAAPRNAGLELARGKYVFFLDADDYLGPEALARMVAMAEENGTDVVLGKMVGVGGRGAPKSMFQRDQPKTDVFSSRAWWTLSPMKLFRHSLLKRLELRFPTDLRTGEDQPFVGKAYLEASGISIVADYDCVFWVLRDDGNNVTKTTSGSEPRLRYLARMVDMMIDSVPAGPNRDHLAHRHLTVEVRTLVRWHLAREPREQQVKTLARLAEIIDPLVHEGLRERITGLAWLRLHFIRERMLDELLEVNRFETQESASKSATPLLIDNGRAYVRHPFLRDPARSVPDAYYDVTDRIGTRHHVSRAELRGTELRLAGHAYLHRVATDEVTTAVLLRERDSKVEYRLPVTHTPTPGLGADQDAGHFAYEQAGFEAVVDIDTAADGKPLADGLWDICLTVGAQGLSREARIGSKRDKDLDGKPDVRVVETTRGARAVTLYTTKPHGNYTIDLGEQKHRVMSRLPVEAFRWSTGDPGRLVVTGQSTLGAYPDGDLTVVLTGDGKSTVDFPAERTAHRDNFTAHVQVSELPAGLWRGELRLGDWAAPLPALPKTLPPAKWRRRGRTWYAKPASGGDGKKFGLRVAQTSVVKAIASRLKP